MYADMYNVYIGIQENIKGNGVDDDSGLGTSRYRSSLSYTISDVRTDNSIYSLIITICCILVLCCRKQWKWLTITLTTLIYLS